MQQRVQRHPVEEATSTDDRPDLRTVADVGQRVRIQEQQIGDPAPLHRAHLLFLAQKPGRITRGGLQRLQRRESRPHQQGKLGVDARWQLGE